MRRQVSEQGREIDWQCHHCGCRDAQYFTRDGHYRRELQTGWGQVQNLQVPMVECQKCQHDVVCEYAILEKHHRFWLDLDQDVLWSSGCCQSLREISERWSASLGRTVGLRTVNERINQVERLVNTYHEQPFEEAPDVVQLDGIWLTLQQETGAVRSDKRQRTRPEKQGKRVVVLVALGFWQHGGKQEIIDWQIAGSRGTYRMGVFPHATHASRSDRREGAEARSSVMGVEV